jgi:hypothetical protein
MLPDIEEGVSQKSPAHSHHRHLPFLKAFSYLSPNFTTKSERIKERLNRKYICKK